jgi:DNA polymerase-1
MHPVHDAALVMAPLDRLDEDIAAMRAIMAEASRIILDGFEVRTGVEIFRSPDRFMDVRGREMWDRVMRLIEGKKCARESDRYHNRFAIWGRFYQPRIFR